MVKGKTLQPNGRQPGLLEQYAHLSERHRGQGYGRRPGQQSQERSVQGTIRRLMADRGFGFVQTEGVREDIFFHRSSVQEVSFEDLKEGDLVEFEMQQNPRAGRICAVNLKPSTKPKSETRSRPPGVPRPQRARGRIFTGWRDDLDRMEQQQTLRRARAEGVAGREGSRADSQSRGNAAARDRETAQGSDPE